MNKKLDIDELDLVIDFMLDNEKKFLKYCEQFGHDKNDSEDIFDSIIEKLHAQYNEYIGLV